MTSSESSEDTTGVTATWQSFKVFLSVLMLQANAKTPAFRVKRWNLASANGLANCRNSVRLDQSRICTTSMAN